MSASKIIKQILIEKGMTVKALADMLGILPTSMRNKLYRDSFSFEEFCKIMDLLGADVRAIMRDSGKSF